MPSPSNPALGSASGGGQMTRHSRYSAWLVAILVAAAALVSGCARPLTDSADGANPAGQPPYGPNVVTLDGLGDIRFGQPSGEMITQGVLDTPDNTCGPRLVDIPHASPVIADGKLVLLWFNPPLATPEGVTVGTPVSEVRAQYPDAQELVPPEKSYTFPGLLVVRGDR